MSPSATTTVVHTETVEDRMVSKKAAHTAPPQTSETQQTPLQAISHGSVPLEGIPTFPNFGAHRKHITSHMAGAFRNFARLGFAEGMSGHISVRDPEFPNGIWMNPLGVHFSLLKASDMILLDMTTGAVLGGNRRQCANEAGFLIHSAVHQARPDVHAACHAHSMAARAYAAFGRPLRMLHQDACLFYDKHSVYAAYGGIVFGKEEGINIARALGPKNKGVILQNHGHLTVGATVDEAAYLFGLMDRCCTIELQVLHAQTAGLKANVISDAEAEYNYIMASEENALYREFQPDYCVEMSAAANSFDDFDSRQFP